MERSLEPTAAMPGKGNTLWHAEWVAAGGQEGPGAHVQQGQLQESARAAEPLVQLANGTAAIEAGHAFADAPVLFLGAVLQIADEAGLPPLPEAFKSCYTFAPGRPLDSSPSTLTGRDNRQARLNGTAAAAAKMSGQAHKP